MTSIDSNAVRSAEVGKAWATPSLASVVGGLLISLFAACSSSSDGTTCGSTTVIPPTVTVTDATTAAPICDANVAVTEGPGANGTSLDGAPDPDLNQANCRYVGSRLTTPGTHTLQVSKTGYQTVTVPNVVTYSHSCGDSSPLPEAQAVNVSLTPD
jgi:hypothetical protein